MAYNATSVVTMADRLACLLQKGDVLVFMFAFVSGWFSLAALKSRQERSSSFFVKIGWFKVKKEVGGWGVFV